MSAALSAVQRAHHPADILAHGQPLRALPETSMTSATALRAPSLTCTRQLALTAVVTAGLCKHRAVATVQSPHPTLLNPNRLQQDRAAAETCQSVSEANRAHPLRASTCGWVHRPVAVRSRLPRHPNTRTPTHRGRNTPQTHAQSRGLNNLHSRQPAQAQLSSSAASALAVALVHAKAVKNSRKSRCCCAMKASSSAPA